MWTVWHHLNFTHIEQGNKSPGSVFCLSLYSYEGSTLTQCNTQLSLGASALLKSIAWRQCQELWHGGNLTLSPTRPVTLTSDLNAIPDLTCPLTVYSFPCATLHAQLPFSSIWSWNCYRNFLLQMEQNIFWLIFGIAWFSDGISCPFQRVISIHFHGCLMWRDAYQIAPNICSRHWYSGLPWLSVAGQVVCLVTASHLFWKTHAYINYGNQRVFSM